MSQTNHILIREARPANVGLIVSELRHDGLECVARSVTAGKEFLAALRDSPPHLLLADSPLPDGNGLSAMTAQENITGRKQLEEALRESDRFNQQIVASAQEGIVVYGPELKCQVWNPFMERLTGMPAAEVLGKHPDEVLPAMRKAGLMASIAKALAGAQSSSGDFHLQDLPSGKSVWISQTDAPLRNAAGAIIGVIGIVRDITERKRAELRIAAFASLGLRLNVARTARDAGKIIVEAADDLLGWDSCLFNLYSAAEHQMTHLLSMDTIGVRRTVCQERYPTSPPTELAQKAIAEGGQLILRDHPETMRFKGVPFGDETRPSASLMFVPIRHGTAVLGVISIQSYTLRAYDAYSLETLQALANHCGGALDRITAEESLVTAQEQLRQAQKMEAVGQLAGGVAHDFNNLLAVIRGNAEIVLMNEDQLTPQAMEGLKHVVEASERAANLTRQLLTFSRKQVLLPQPLVLNKVIANLTKMLARIIGENIDLRCHYAEPLPWVQADTSMMEQVILNLIVNARDAMPGGGQMRVATEHLGLDEAHARLNPEARPGEFVCLSVSDTGTGIAPEVLPRIFEPFFTTKDVGKGTGLGLATVYGIVKQHKGWIEVFSKVGEGSRFKVFLPSIPAPAQPAGASEVGADVRGGNETILLVEDDHAVRMTTRRVLESKGYSIQEAMNAPEALELWQKHAGEIALLVTDIVMSEGMTGRDLAERLWKQGARLNVIFMSGYTADVLGQNTNFIRRTGSRFLQKPCSSRTLLQTVRQCLDKQGPQATAAKAGLAR